MKLTLKATCVFILCCQSAIAQLGVDADIGPHTYTQDFDGVYPADDGQKGDGEDNDWINNSTLIGWYSAKENPSPTYLDEYRISSGNETSVTRFYSYGYTFPALNSSDRALGFQTSSTIGNSALGVLFENTGSSTINSISIHVTGEQWRRNGGCSKNQQRIKIGYLIDVDIASTLSDPTDGPDLLINDSFMEIPEAFLVNMDTTSNTSTLDGNAPQNQSVLSLTFPINLAPGSEVLIRFYDEEISCGEADPPIAIDDLTLIFSTQIQSTQFNPDALDAFEDCNHTIAQYLSNIAKNIPENPASKPEPGYPVYVAPTGPEYASWTTILTDFFINQDFVSAGNAVGSFGYELIEFPKAGDPSNPYRIIRKNPESTNYWGTMALNPNASQIGSVNHLNLQAPHAVNDNDSGIQGASIFMHTDAYSYVFAGADRCSNDVSTGCSGSGKCNNGGGDYHSTADLAHDSFNLMDLSMRIIAQDNDNSHFVQLHGFGTTAFDFVISNGTEHTPADPSRDFAYKIATELRAIDPDEILGKDEIFDVRVPHKNDPISELRGFTNNQGKWLNNIEDESFDPCNDGDSPKATGRFVHLEQYSDIREKHVMHILLSNAILSALDSTLPVELLSFHVNAGKNGETVLVWEVASEINHSHYEVEISQDGKDFIQVAKVSTPIKDHPITYQWKDKNYRSSSVYYRIKQVDTDGEYHYFPVKYYQNEIRKPFIYPNPANDLLEVKSDSSPTGIFHISGRRELLKVIKEDPGTTILDISHLSPGIYLVSIGEATYKFVKL